MNSGIRTTAVNALPCSFNLSSALSIPYVPSRPESPQRGSVAAFVSFSWEEKPGISKRFGDGVDNLARSKPSCTQREGRNLFVGDLDVLPLPMPPRLQKPSGFELNRANVTDSPRSRCHEQKRSVAECSPSTKRQPRKGRAEDDPFFRAIQACTTRNGAESKGSYEAARKLSTTTLLQKLFETEDYRSEPKKTYSARVSHSFSTDGKPTFGLSVTHCDPGQLLEERGRRSGGLWRYTDQRNSSAPRTKSGVMVLSQRRLMLGSCLGCRNPDGFEPSAILARAKASASPRSSY